MFVSFWVGNEELVNMYEEKLGDAGYHLFKLPQTNNRGDEDKSKQLSQGTFRVNLLHRQFCVLLLFVSSYTACDRCLHQSKASYFSKAYALSSGACRYESLALDISGGHLAAGVASLFIDGVGCGACFQDTEAKIHCAEWLSIIGGSSTGEQQIRREESLPIFKRRLFGGLLEFAARELQVQVLSSMADENGQISTSVFERLVAVAVAGPYESVSCAFVSYGFCAKDLAIGWKYRSRLWTSIHQN
ncbi:hypothetical protein JHK85_053722 [Glycine max]|nr:hypothetical protein JHK85_053722 [Glycine max]